MEILKINSMWPENKGFYLEHDGSEDYYIFIHFLTPAEVYLNGKWVECKENACIFYPFKPKRKLRCLKNKLIHNWFHAIGDFDSLMKKYNLSYNTLYYPKNPEFITDIFLDIERECGHKKVFYNEICKSKINELYALISRNIVNEEEKFDSRYNDFLEIRHKIKLQYHQNCDIEALAGQIHLSPTRFYYLYKKYFGISPKQDIINIRIDHAKTLLMQKRYSVEEIAEMIGYENTCHFIRQFKEKTGVTPGKFSS